MKRDAIDLGTVKVFTLFKKYFIPTYTVQEVFYPYVVRYAEHVGSHSHRRHICRAWDR